MRGLVLRLHFGASIEQNDLATADRRMIKIAPLSPACDSGIHRGEELASYALSSQHKIRATFNVSTKVTIKCVFTRMKKITVKGLAKFAQDELALEQKASHNKPKHPSKGFIHATQA